MTDRDRILDISRTMMDTGSDDGHFLSGDGHFFQDDGHFSFHDGQIFSHVEHKCENDGPIIENDGQSHTVPDGFFMIWNDPKEMADSPP